jgi:hypothetical protein
MVCVNQTTETLSDATYVKQVRRAFLNRSGYGEQSSLFREQCVWMRFVQVRKVQMHSHQEASCNALSRTVNRVYTVSRLLRYGEGENEWICHLSRKACFYVCVTACVVALLSQSVPDSQRPAGTFSQHVTITPQGCSDSRLRPAPTPVEDMLLHAHK